MSQANSLIAAYAQEPLNNYEMSNFTVAYVQENGICGDNVRVFLRISPVGIVEEYSFAGYPQMHTKAAASVLAEIIEGTHVDTVLTWDFNYMQNQGLEVSPRRKRSVVSALLAARNAIHLRKNDGIIDSYDDLIPGY